MSDAVCGGNRGGRTGEKSGEVPAYEKLSAGLGGKLQRGIKGIYFAYMAATLFLCVFFLDRIPFPRSEFSRVFLPPVLLLGFGACYLLGMLRLSALLERLVHRGKMMLALASICLLAAQIVMVNQYYFFTDWDVEGLLDFSFLLSRGADPASYASYFSRYPNNLLLAWIYANLRKLALLTGLGRYEYGILLCTQCLLNVLTGVFFALLLYEILGDRRLTIFGYSLYVLLIGFSPWVSIPYSDASGLLFPTFVAWLALKGNSRVHPFLRWFLVGFFAMLGYRIKPQIIILLLAVLLTGTLRLRVNGRKRCLAALCLIVSGLLCAALCCNMAVKSIPLKTDPEAAFGPEHFLMMGLNTEKMGSYSQEDVDFSASFSTRAERKKADLSRALERVEGMGAKGFLRLALQKTLMNYGDGTFCWDGEGSFYIAAVERPTSRLLDFLRNLYYSRDWMGRYFSLWANYAQMLWLCSLLLSCAAAFGANDSRRDCLMLAILGLSLFELLFEARARYLYTYAPLYLVLAVYGVRTLEKRAKRRVE